MRTKLAIIAVSGFAISAVCLGGAFALGGNEIGNAVFDFGDLDQPRCDTMGHPTATADTRSVAWDGQDRAAVALPANIHYQAGNGDTLIVKGDPEIVAHVRVRNGVVGLDCQGGHFHMGRDNRLDITLPGRRTFKSFDLLGVGDMQLADLSQPDVKITLAGSGNIEASGKTDNLKINVSGSGRMKLGELAAKSADVNIAGSGNVEVAPQEALDVSIAGSGNIYLKNEPKKLQTSIFGSGRIIHPDGETQSMPRHNRHARAEEAIIRSALMAATANDNDADEDLERAKAQLSARIKERVAQELSNAEVQ